MESSQAEWSFEVLPAVQVSGSKAHSIKSDDIGSDSSSSSVDAPPKKSQRCSLQQPSIGNVGEEVLEELESSKKTKECNLSGLHLSRVPVKLSVENLVVLSLSSNEIEALPGRLFECDCRQLRELDLNSNKLSALPPSVFKLPNLQNFQFNHNEIAELPLGGMSLPSLRRLGAEFNQLTTFPIEFIEKCPQLEELFLSQNEAMLDAPVPTARLRKARPANAKRITLRVDNRPRLVDQMGTENWARTMPWLNVELHKIYPDKVLGFLFLGSLRTAQTVTVFHDLDIQYVLTVGRDLKVNLQPNMKHLVLAVNDFPEEDMTPLFEEGFRFIEEARAAGKGVLIHCFAGLSRSVTIAAAYIMKYEKKTRDEAMAIIRAARPAARPNDGFLATLLKYEETLKSQAS